MKDKLLRIIKYYGINAQQRQFQEEVFELQEAITIREQEKEISSFTDALDENIVEELADVIVMIKQFQLYYDISNDAITRIAKYKINRQLERIERKEKNDSFN